MKQLAMASALAFGISFSSGLAQQRSVESLSDDEVRELIIQESIASYSGSCPCPYNRASNGSRCGGRSAYSRPGGARPKCYKEDVSEADVARYRARH